MQLGEEGHGEEEERAVCLESGIVFNGGWQAAVGRVVLMVGGDFTETVRKKAVSATHLFLRFLKS